MKLRNIIEKNKQKYNQERLTEYLHSYLAWLYHQNHQFHETLTNEELTNYFVDKIEHEECLTLYIKNNPLSIMAEIYEFIDSFKSDANMFIYSIDIKPKITGPYREMNRR